MTLAPIANTPRRQMLKRLSLLGLATQASLQPAKAQSFPMRPLRLVVPFPAGGGTDAMARALGNGLHNLLGQTIVIENKAGAGTAIGNDLVAKSDPDGHTLLLTTSAFSILPGLQNRLPYDADTAFAPITRIGIAPNVIVVRNDSPLTSGADLLRIGREQPDTLFYGSAGNGTSTHLAAESLQHSADVSFTHVPYRGAAPAVNDVLGGQVDLVFATMPSVAPMIQQGMLRALAVTSAARSPLLPDVPTMAESGAPGYSAEVWYGVFTTAGTPPAAIAKLYEAINQAARSENFVTKATAEGLVLTLDQPDATARIVKDDQQRWRDVILAQGVTLD